MAAPIVAPKSIRPTRVLPTLRALERLPVPRLFPADAETAEFMSQVRKAFQANHLLFRYFVFTAKDTEFRRNQSQEKYAGVCRDKERLLRENEQLQQAKKDLKLRAEEAEARLAQERQKVAGSASAATVVELRARLAEAEAELVRRAAQVQDLTHQREQLKSRLEAGLNEPGPPALPTPESLELNKADEAPEEAMPDAPATLADIAPWVREHLAGKVIVRDKALEEAAQSAYARPELIYRALWLLATSYRDMRRGTQRCDWAGLLAQHGLADHHTLGEAASNKVRENHTFVVDGAAFFMDRHIKRGNSRDARNCLRIYFTWNAERQAVIVGALPEHLRIDLT